MGRWKIVGRAMLVCLYVCPSIFGHGARAAGRIGTDEYSIDAPEWWKDDGIGFGPINCIRHVTRAIAQTMQKPLVNGAGQTNGRI